MVLCWCRYNKEKYVLILAIGKTSDKIIALKVQEPPGPILMSDKSINSMKSSKSELLKLDLKERISTIKKLVREFGDIYRTYKIDKLKILDRFTI